MKKIPRNRARKHQFQVSLESTKPSLSPPSPTHSKANDQARVESPLSQLNRMPVLAFQWVNIKPFELLLTHVLKLTKN